MTTTQKDRIKVKPNQIVELSNEVLEAFAATPYDEMGALTRSLRKLNPQCANCGSCRDLFYVKVDNRSISASKLVELHCKRCVTLARRSAYVKQQQKIIKLQIRFGEFAERILEPYAELLEIEPKTKLTVRHRISEKNRPILRNALITRVRRLKAKCTICATSKFTLSLDRTEKARKTVMYLVFTCFKCHEIESNRRLREETRNRRKAMATIRKFIQETLLTS